MITFTAAPHGALHDSNRPGRLGLILAGLAAAAPAAIGANAVAGLCTPPDLAVFALEGDAAPGTGRAFQSFDRPNRSGTGAIAFTADTDGATADDDVVYVNMTLVAREGDPAPGVPGGTFGTFEFFETGHQVNAGGSVVYIATLRDVPTTQDRAVYHDAALVALEGSEAPGIPGRFFADFGFAGVTDSGAVGFLADLSGSTSDDSVIYLGGAVLYREGETVPGLPETTWDGNFDEVQFNGRGDVLFEGNTSLSSAVDGVVFRRLNNPALGVVEAIVAQEGQAIAARTGPDVMASVVQTALAENGMWALRGTLGAAPAGSDEFIMSEWGFYAQQGDPVDELIDVVLGSFGAVTINSAGDVVYLADLEGATPPGIDEGLFINGCLALFTSAEVPGLPADTLFTDFGFEDVSASDDGQVVFAASYGGAVSGDGLFTFTIGSAAPECPADLDGSGSVGFSDLLGLLSAWGSCPSGAPCAADLDGDLLVGSMDLGLLLAAWGACD